MNKNLESGVIKTLPKAWTKEETDMCLKLRMEGLSSADIAKKVGRSNVSVSIKLKRVGKRNDTYNKKHREDKYKHNQLFLDRIQPRSILDVYAGNSFYQNAQTNDIDESFDCDYNMSALKLLCFMNYKGEKFDLIDLDPYGSAIDCFALALNIARQGIVITLGEMGHKRWKRLDFVRKWYRIENFSDFTTDNLVKELQRIALCNKKILTPVYIRDYNRISRVWFEISDYKTTEQWEVRNIS